MIRAAALGLAALGLAAPVVAAEGGAIRGGEHDGFTRIVLTVEPTTEWSLETASGRATIHFPGRQLEFATGGVFDKIPRSRVVGVASAADATGTTVSVDLGCDCRVSTSFVGARYLALDVADRDAASPEPPVPSETPEARAAREAEAVASAEEVLIRQIERAASQGVVRLSVPDAAPEPDTAAPPPRALPPTPPKLSPVAVPAAAAPAPADSIAALDEQDQIEATTVFDRDSRAAVAERGSPKPAPACLADDRLDVGAWSNGMPFASQVPALRRALVGEFDIPSPGGISGLARLYIRFGFGAEAEALLSGFAAAPDVEDRTLLVDLARAVEGRPAAPDGPLAFAGTCPGRYGLWLALGGRAPAFQDAASFATVQSAFAALPPDLRVLVGPGLAGRLLDAGHPAEARLIYDTTVRPGEPPNAPLELVAARLAAAEGDPEAAAAAMTAILDADGHAAADTVMQLVRVALDAHLPIPDRVVTDLRAAALQSRGAASEPALRELLIEALARRDELRVAIREARAAAADLPDAAKEIDALAVRMMAEADPQSVGPAAYSETVLGAADLIEATPDGDPARTAIAGRLVQLGLPTPALALVTPALTAGDAAARLTAAQASLRLGDPETARAALGPLAGTEAVELRARSFALDGAYDRALSTLANRGLASDAADYAWPAGDWTRAQAGAGEDARRKAMAGFMAVSAGEAEPQAPAADPGALDPEQAFGEPLPPLARPSLDAARRLLSTGGKVGGFVENVLADN